MCRGKQKIAWREETTVAKGQRRGGKSNYFAGRWYKGEIKFQICWLCRDNEECSINAMNLKIYLCIIYGCLIKSENSFPQNCTHVHTWTFASHFRGLVTPQNPCTELLVQRKSNKWRMEMYISGSLIHSGYHMKFSLLPWSCPALFPPPFLIATFPFLRLALTLFPVQ